MVGGLVLTYKKITNDKDDGYKTQRKRIW